MQLYTEKKITVLLSIFLIDS